MRDLGEGEKNARKPREEQKVKIQKATIPDVRQIYTLINYFADRGEMLHRPLSEIYENLRDFFVAKDGEQVLGCVALHLTWADLAEVKSMAVMAERQREGIGRILAEACIEEASHMGLPTIFCLTYKPDFFKAVGFEIVDMESLPRKVWGECYRCVKFPDCDETAMTRKIK